jgi:hypothetical protein
MVAVMVDQRDTGCVDAPPERRAVLVAFLGAGMPSAPSTALMVEALAGARRAVAMCQAHGRAVDEWLAGEVGLRGVRENAAVLAVLELLPARREETARAYRLGHRTALARSATCWRSLTRPVRPRAYGPVVRGLGGQGEEPAGERRPLPDPRRVRIRRLPIPLLV